MSNDNHDSAWFTEEQAMLGMALLSIVLAALVILPYLQYVLLGIVFAYILWPIRKRMYGRMRPNLTALTLTIAAVVTVLVPLSYLLLRASQEVFAVIEEIERGAFDLGSIEDHLASIGLTVDVETVFEENRETIANAMEMVAWSVFDIVRSLPRLFIGLTITVFVLFILLRDGHRLNRWMRTMVPLNRDIQRELFDRLDRLTRASVIGNIAASGIQAVALAIGLWVIGFDNVVFLGVLTFILALLPLVGAFLVWVPLVAYLLLIGSPTAAVVLLVYGSLVSASDFYTRPIVIGHSAALNSAVIVVGVFGGLIVFGAIGLLIGPVVLGGAKIAIEVLVRQRKADLGDPIGS